MSASSSARPADSFFVLRSHDSEPGRKVWFCSHCGAEPELDGKPESNARVCERCSFGLLLECEQDVAPGHGGSFIVVDSSLSVCAVSRAAESILGIGETDAVNRHITELLVPAEAEAEGTENLAVAVTWAARGERSKRRTVVRPVNTFGVRLRTRIASCGPPQAALLVFE